ncbi:MAG: hypothetical protein JWN38_441 [Candidatus Saccharibacteria bacterium]|nr:hypothetical protein [Candidatus Saccharibacteria bacterium]
MKISVNWIQEYLQFELPSIDELVTKIGAQLGAVESVIDLTAQYQGIVVVKVVECSKLEGSDHLNVCLIDDGGVVQGVDRNEQGLVQVVCGAPNVRAGITVAWLPPGATVPSSFGKEPFVLGSRELRGVVSNGMLASPKELAIGDSHEGILEIDFDCSPGADFAETFKLNDQIIDIENKMFTHRPDCFGQLGVAREIAGILGRPFTSPDWWLGKQRPIEVQSALPLVVKNELPELVPRFTAIALAGVTIKPSPVWLQTYLSRLGIRPINNVVDVTNYIMMLTGQPLHAYDYDQVRALDGGEAATLIARNPRDSERLTLLNGKTINPRQQAIMIATETTLIGLGGVMGGADTEVTEATTNVILECATFDMYSIRRTSMTHGIFSDAVTRFTKGQSPLQNTAILQEAAFMIADVAGASFGSEVVDLNALPEEVTARGALYPAIAINASFSNDRLGLNLTADEMAGLLGNVECAVSVDGDHLTVTMPFWRTDVEVREDIVEEVGRLYGFDKLPLELPERSIVAVVKNSLLETKRRLRERLRRTGANEVLTYSFVHGKLLEQTGQDPELAFRLGNALSPELQYYRISLMPSLLDKIHANIKTGYDEFAIFEIGKSHVLQHKDDGEDGLPLEMETLALAYAAADKLKKPGDALYTAKKYLAAIADELNIELKYVPITELPDAPMVKLYEQHRSAFVRDAASDEFLGIVGEFTAVTRKNLKLPVFAAGFELDNEALLKVSGSHSRYQALPRFPATEQDVCFRVPSELPYAELHDFVIATLAEIKPEQTKLSVAPLDLYQKDEATKQITFRLHLASYERTLTDKEVGVLVQVLAEKAQQTLNATLV